MGSVVFGVATLFVTRAIAEELGLRISWLGSALLLTNGVLIAQGVLVDSAVQQSLAAALVVWAYTRRFERPGVVSWVLVGIATGGACCVEPRLLLLVAGLMVVDLGLAWVGGRRWEVLWLAPIAVGAVSCAVAVAYRAKLGGDFKAESVWSLTRSAHVAVGLVSAVATGFAVVAARRSPRNWVLVAWLVTGMVAVAWAAVRSDPPVWWSLPAVWMVWLAWLRLPARNPGDAGGSSMRWARLAQLTLGSGLMLVSALGWFMFLRPVADLTSLTTTLFNESRLGDQVIFLPSSTRISFEFDRPADRLTPVPEYPDAPWGGYPSSSADPSEIPVPVLERISDTATRLWIVSDTSKEGNDFARLGSLGFLKQQMPVIDEQSGSIRIQCFQLAVQ